MCELKGISGIKSGRVDCEIVKSISAALRTTPKLATTAAGEDGALSVWIGDDGYYRTSFHQFCQTINGPNIIATKAKVRQWLKEWWPKLGDQKQLARMFR